MKKLTAGLKLTSGEWGFIVKKNGSQELLMPSKKTYTRKELLMVLEATNSLGRVIWEALGKIRRGKK